MRIAILAAAAVSLIAAAAAPKPATPATPKPGAPAAPGPAVPAASKSAATVAPKVVALPAAELVATGNFDGDADGNDEIIAWTFRRISFYRRDAGGLREVHAEKAPGEEKLIGTPSMIAVADLDGDGRDDALLGFGASKGSGNAPIQLAALRIKDLGTGSEGAKAGGQDSGKPAGGDAGKRAKAAKDLARGRVLTILHQSDSERPLVSGLVVGDFEGDRRPEILLAFYDSKYFVSAAVLSLLPGGDPLGGALPEKALGRIRMGTSWAVGKVGREPRPSILVGRPYGDEMDAPGDLFLLDGERRVPVPTQLGVHAVAIGDGDGDGTSEIYFGDGWNREYAKARGRLSVAHEASDGRWASELIDDAEGRNEVRKIAIADVDGDGKPELVVAGNAFIALYWKGPGGWMVRRLTDGNDFAIARRRGGFDLVVPGDPIRLVPLDKAREGSVPVRPRQD